MKKCKPGKIIIPKNTLIQPHELESAAVLSWKGDNVEFLPVGSKKSADIKFQGKEWEIKAPKGKSNRTIENNMRRALQQSDNIIIDLARCKILELKAIREIRRQCYLLKQLKTCLVITKNRKILIIQE